MNHFTRAFAIALALLSGCAATITEKDRATARIRYDFAVVQLGEGRTRDALRDLLSAIELDPEQHQFHNAIGLVYHALGRQEEALTHYATAVRLDPGFSSAHNNYGVLLLDLGRYEEAIEQFKRALADVLYPTPSLAEGNMGWAYFKSGDVETGKRRLRNAVATNPKFCRGYEWLARIGLDTEDPDAVVSNCARFVRYCLDDENIAPTIPKSYRDEMSYYCGLGHLKQGDPAGARERFSACADRMGNATAVKCAESLTGLD